MSHLAAVLLAFALAVLVLGSPTSLAPRSNASSCTDSSLNGFGWQVVAFDFHASAVFSTPAHQNAWGYASFSLSNPALPGAAASCSAQSAQLSDFFDGTQRYPCTGTGAGASAAPAPASFAFNRPSGELDVNQTWVCSDKDPQYPTRFSAAGRTNLTLDCTTTVWQNPNWTIGAIYSDTEVKCALATVHVKPFLMTAVA